MITNNTITYYHKGIDEETKLETWTKYVFNKVWEHGRKGSSTNKGYAGSNNIDVRIPMEYVSDKNLFTIGDIIAIGEQPDIEKQSDLQGKEFYNVTSITINEYGENKHIHLGGV